MAKTVDFSKTPAKYASLPNRIMFVRERVLGMTRAGFVDAVKSRDSKNTVSAETLKKLEKDGKASETTVTRVELTLNGLLEKGGFEPVDRDLLMTPFPVGTPSNGK